MPTLRWKHARLLGLALATAATTVVAVVLTPGRPKDRPPPIPATTARGDASPARVLLRGHGARRSNAVPPRADDPSSTRGIAGTYAIHGRVSVEGSKTGHAGARVRAVLDLGLSTEELGETATAPDGTYELHLPLLGDVPPLALRTGELRVGASAPGAVMKGAWAKRRLSRVRGPTQWTINLCLRRGRVLTGRVLDAGGRPVAFTEVRGSGTGAPSRPRALTDGEGRYQLLIDAGTVPGRRGAGDLHVTVHAKGRGIGSIVLPKPGEDGGAVLRAPDIVLEGEGVLEGVAVFPDGQRAAAVRIEAWLPRRPRSSEAKGLTSAETWTDEGGCFHIQGLHPGVYTIRPAVLYDDLPSNAHFTVHCPTPATNVHLIVPRRRIRVLVRDVNGAPLPGGSVFVRRYRNNTYISSSGASTRAPDATMSWWEPAGTRLELAALLPGPVVAEKVVTVQDDVWSEDVVLVLEEAPRPWGYFRPHLITSGVLTDAPFRVSVATPSRGTLIWESWTNTSRAEKPIGPLPPGRWRLAFDTPGTGREERGFWLPGRTMADILPGGVTDVVFRPRTGGRIRATLQAQAASEAETAPRLLLACEGKDRFHSLWTDWDEPALGPVLEPGPWTLRSATEGYEVIEKDCVVAAGRIVDVVVRRARE